MLDEFSEEQGAEELESRVYLGPCFIGLQGATRKPFFLALRFEA